MVFSDELWPEKQNILVILAHPDDPEFFCGATISRWIKKGHKVTYCLLTHGEKGSDDLSISEDEVSQIRKIEQSNAAKTLGVSKIQYLDYPDGYLQSDLEIRKNVVRIIRQETPDIVVTSDPINYYPSESYINHADHRTAGQIVIDAVFPAAGNARFFPELIQEGYKPHSVGEVWLSLTDNPNVVLDVSDYWQDKIDALCEHKSQIGDREKFIERMLGKKTSDSDVARPRFEEKFRRFVFQ